MLMDCYRESECKLVHDPFATAKNCVSIEGPVIVGAGPSGLAVAACLKAKGIPSLILERSNCVASLWQLMTYDRLRLHLPKRLCELPLMPFPAELPTYPTRPQFVRYMEAYAGKFGIQPVFNMLVVSAEYQNDSGGGGFWRVIAERASKEERVEYECRWLVVATGENAEAVVPEIDGMEEFKGHVVHTSLYRSGEAYSGKKVLVVGCGNSGMEVCLDLCNHNARPSIVVRDTVHVLPREMLGSSTFRLSMWLLRWLPVRTVDRLLLLIAHLTLGDTKKFGLVRPQLGPLELKSISGKTPVLDVGTLAKIKSGEVKVFPAIRQFTQHGAMFVDGRSEDFDAVVLATGYKSNVPSWLKERDLFSEKDGLPKMPFPDGWKGKSGLYAVGFSKRGLWGAAIDATRIAKDIEKSWKTNA